MQKNWKSETWEGNNKNEIKTWNIKEIHAKNPMKSEKEAKKNEEKREKPVKTMKEAKKSSENPKKTESQRKPM